MALTRRQIQLLFRANSRELEHTSEDTIFFSVLLFTFRTKIFEIFTHTYITYRCYVPKFAFFADFGGCGVMVWAVPVV